MLRIVVKCLLVCIVIVAVASYALYLKTGRLWLPNFLFSSLSWPGGEPRMRPLEAPAQPTWRWRENGRWHYGDNPPPGAKAERIDQAAEE